MSISQQLLQAATTPSSLTTTTTTTTTTSKQQLSSNNNNNNMSPPPAAAATVLSTPTPTQTPILTRHPHLISCNNNNNNSNKKTVTTTTTNSNTSMIGNQHHHHPQRTTTSMTSTNHRAYLYRAHRFEQLSPFSIKRRRATTTTREDVGSGGSTSRLVRSSEYRNLRQVVPCLRRQRDVGKVEVVTEAARYIDHLHKTLIERFILTGIPDSLKEILGTDDANELNSKHIMNLVMKMAANQRQQQQQHASSGQQQQQQADAASFSSNRITSSSAGARAMPSATTTTTTTTYPQGTRHLQQQQQQQRILGGTGNSGQRAGVAAISARPNKRHCPYKRSKLGKCAQMMKKKVQQPPANSGSSNLVRGISCSSSSSSLPLPVPLLATSMKAAINKTTNSSCEWSVFQSVPTKTTESLRTNMNAALPGAGVVVATATNRTDELTNSELDSEVNSLVAPDDNHATTTHNNKEQQYDSVNSTTKTTTLRSKETSMNELDEESEQQND